jgi:hypothetical protein
MQRQQGLGFAAVLVGGVTLVGPFISPPWILALVVTLCALTLWRFFDTKYLTYTFCVLAALYGTGLLPFFVFATTLAMLVLGELVFQTGVDDLNTYLYYIISTAWAGVLVMAYLNERAILTVIFGIIVAVLFKVILLKYTTVFECLDAILPTLTIVVNHSLLTGEFPLIFKTAIVKPLLKKTSLDSEDLKNYRPISNLSFMSKVLEKVVLFQILQHINCNELLSDFQSAYRPHHSTETALLKVTNDLLSAMDDGKISVLVLLDLSVAFDTIDHEILLHRLHNVFGFGNTVLSWFQSYLENRTQTVVVHGKHSTRASLRYGVPQGSVLGPILLFFTHSLDQMSFNIIQFFIKCMQMTHRSTNRADHLKL